MVSRYYGPGCIWLLTRDGSQGGEQGNDKYRCILHHCFKSSEHNRYSAAPAAQDQFQNGFPRQSWQASLSWMGDMGMNDHILVSAAIRKVLVQNGRSLQKKSLWWYISYSCSLKGPEPRGNYRHLKIGAFILAKDTGCAHSADCAWRGQHGIAEKGILVQGKTGYSPFVCFRKYRLKPFPGLIFSSWSPMSGMP